MKAGNMTSGGTGAFGAWLGKASSRISEMFFGNPPALPLRFSDAVDRIVFHANEVVVPARILGSEQVNITKVDQPCVVDLYLPSDVVFERTIDAPKNAQSKLNEIAELDLVRKTPFTVQDVYAGLSKPNRVGDELRVQQFIIKRSELSTILARLNKIGCVARKVFLDAGTTDVLMADRTVEVAPMAKVWRRVNVALVAVIAGLASILWLAPGWQASAEQVDLEADLIELRAELVALRSEVDARTASATASERFVQFVHERPKLVELLRELTLTLPDDVWLTDLAMRQNGLTISGETAGSATDLVLKLSSVEQFQQARLAGAVTRLPDNKERFQISFKLRGSE